MPSTLQHAAETALLLIKVHRFTSADGPIDAATAIHLNMLPSKFSDAEGERDKLGEEQLEAREAAAENQALKWNDWTQGCTRAIVLKSTKPGVNNFVRAVAAKVGSHGVFG